MGYHATGKDTKIVGSKCAKSVPTFPIVWGCVPPPKFFFKLLAQYNIALLEQPNYPYKDMCEADLGGFSQG